MRNTLLRTRTSGCPCSNAIKGNVDVQIATVRQMLRTAAFARYALGRDSHNNPSLWPLPPLRPKRAACGVAGLRCGSGQLKTNHALMSETSVMVVSSFTVHQLLLPISDAEEGCVTLRNLEHFR